VIDFAALALGPGIAAFGRPVTVKPTSGKPPIAPFPATGVWSSRNVDLSLVDQQSMNTRVVTLGIALAAWPMEPKPGWAVRIPAAGSLADEGTLWIDDVDLDGQGGATLTLKKQPKGA
jgi:hypothetical protein